MKDPTMTGKPAACRICGKVLSSKLARHHHERDAHDPAWKARQARKAARRAADEAEPSIASRVIEASLDRAMGLPVDPEIAETFGDFL